MVKIRISYERPQELEAVLKLLSPVVKTYKESKNDKGRFKKVYAEMLHIE